MTKRKNMYAAKDSTMPIAKAPPSVKALLVTGYWLLVTGYWLLLLLLDSTKHRSHEAFESDQQSESQKW
jgi:hypothetical protein